MSAPVPRRSSAWLPARWGIRRQSVITAVVVVGVALFVGAVALLAILQSALSTTERSELTARTSDLAALITSRGLDTAKASVSTTQRRGQLTQLVDSRGTVIAASDPRLTGRPLVVDRPADDATVITELESVPAVGDLEDFLVAARSVPVGDQTYVIIVAGPVQVEADTLQTVAVFLLGATPLIVLLVGLAVWFLVGRSLRSVEQIRGQVDRITAENLSTRVAVPPSQDEIAALATTMNTMLGRLEASDRALRAFVSDASHELRSPLSTVVTAGEVADLDPTGEAWRSSQPLVLAEARRMQRLVEDLLTLARADADALIDRRVEVDLDDVVDREVRRLRAVTGHDVTVQIEPARVTGDNGRLAQVVRNLLDNAEHHAASTIRVRSRVASHQVVLEIDNDGPPVPFGQRSVVFDRFVRLDESRDRDSGGSGLGLAISAEIVRLHGGTIGTGASEEGWCRFTVTLPLRDW